MFNFSYFLLLEKNIYNALTFLCSLEIFPFSKA